MADGDTSTDLGTKLHMGSAAGKPASFDATGFAAISMTQIKGPVSIPSFGDEVADISEPTLADSRVEHFNGVKDGGLLTVPIKYIEGDAGQALLLANKGSNDTFSFKVEDADGAVHYFYGRIGSVRRREITTTSNKGYVATIMINSAVVDVAAP